MKPTAMKYTVKLQPIIPFSVGTNWLLLTRAILPYTCAEASAPGDRDKSGLEDPSLGLFLTALMVFVLYGAYHLFENFFIVPRVYGKKLKLSKLAVPLAVAAGGAIAGVVGAIAVLPIVAAYPVVERLWLAPKGGSENQAH